MSPLKQVLLIFTFCLFSQASAEEVKGSIVPESAATKLDQETLSEMERMRTEPKISSEFARGEYLIFDCSKRYFTCVNKVSFEKCKLLREKGYRGKRKLLPCAPLKEFKSQEACFKKQYSLIHNQKAKGYCLNSRNTGY